jgi:hypothetical protein
MFPICFVSFSNIIKLKSDIEREILIECVIRLFSISKERKKNSYICVTD